MNKLLSIIFTGCLSTLALSSCMDNHDSPDTDNLLITSPTSVGEVNMTIGEVKDKYCANGATADFQRNASNFYSKINEDIIITGVIAANDISGNLYQTLLLRNIGTDGTDQSILLKIKNTCLYPYFKVGQRIKVNLKGLWAGCYSKVPIIGQPYKTSYGNLNLGPMLFEMCRTNIELVGQPDDNAPETVPLDFTDATGEAWLRASANKIYRNTPLLAKVSGLIDEAQNSTPAVGEVTGETETMINGHKMFAPYELHDNGYGVDRTISLKTNTSNVVLRTSTKNEIAYRYLPADERSYTGVLNYYDGWQLQLRSLDDVYPALKSNSEIDAETATYAQ